MNSVKSDAPNVYVTTIARMSDGNAMTISPSRISTVSILPPLKPAVTPTTVPNASAISVGTRPITSEMRAP